MVGDKLSPAYSKVMVKNTVISYPIPPYQNLPIEAQYYQPSMFMITALSLGVLTTVTTAINHNYVVGQQCRLIIPSKYGSIQLNEKTGFVLSIPAPNQVVLDTNSQICDPFIASPTFVPFQTRTLPQILAIGDENSGAINPIGRRQHTFIPGSFRDISPL